jgi:hypothetical protein
VQDQDIGRLRPPGSRQQRTEFRLDLLRAGSISEADTLGHAEHVPIDGEAGHPERMTEYDIRRLAPDAR